MALEKFIGGLGCVRGEIAPDNVSKGAAAALIGSSCSWVGICRDILPSHRRCPRESAGAVAGSGAQQGCASRAGGSGWGWRHSCPLGCCGCSSGCSCAGVSADSLVSQPRASRYQQGHRDPFRNGVSFQAPLRQGSEGAQVHGPSAFPCASLCLRQPVPGCIYGHPHPG